MFLIFAFTGSAPTGSQAERFIRQQKQKGHIELSFEDNKCIAMTVYTMEGQPREKSVYFQLNKVLILF